MPRVKRQQTSRSTIVTLSPPPIARSVERLRRITDNEFVSLAVALAFKLASKVFLGAVHKIRSGFGKPQRDKFGKAVGFD